MGRKYKEIRDDYHGRMLQEICNKLGIEHHKLWTECCQFGENPKTKEDEGKA